MSLPRAARAFPTRLWASSRSPRGRPLSTRWWRWKQSRRALPPGQDGAGPDGVFPMREEDHFGLPAHAERVDRLSEVAPEYDLDALALQQPANHQGFGLVAAAVHLDKARGGVSRRRLGEADDLGPARHGLMLA